MIFNREITEDTVYIGVDDRRLHLFENVFPIPRGITFNSFLIKDEKTALLDTVDRTVADEFMNKLEIALEGRDLDYIVVNHMEPDHCAAINSVLCKYPNVKIVGNVKTFKFLSQFFSFDLSDEQKVIVKEGDSLSLGKHNLKFFMAAMVHWPEVMFTYDEFTKALYSADAFGVFGANSGNIFNDEMDYKSKEFVDDARRYYSNIVGKYGLQTNMAIKKASGLDIEYICPLHGPIWREDINFIVDLYKTWASYEPEDKALVAIYNSVYGNTDSVVSTLLSILADKGVKNIAAYDVSKTDVSVLVSEVFRASNILIAATTYNNALFPLMENFMAHIKALNVQNRKYSIIENGTWAPQSGKIITADFESMKNMEAVGDKLTVKSAQYDYDELLKLADDIKESLK